MGEEAVEGPWRAPYVCERCSTTRIVAPHRVELKGRKNTGRYRGRRLAEPSSQAQGYAHDRKINPISNGNIAPPTIAITRSEPPSFVFGPRPLRPSAKIVGNISDMKKLERRIVHTPGQPGEQHRSRRAVVDHAVGTHQLAGRDIAHQKVATKRPTMNATSEPVRK